MLFNPPTQNDKYPSPIEVIESQDGTMLLRGVLCKADEPTLSGNVYSREVLEATIKRLDESIKSRSIIGELSHPKDSVIHLNGASHLLRDLRLEDDGKLVVEATLMKTPCGKMLEKLLREKVKLRFGMRGVGGMSMTEETISTKDFGKRQVCIVNDSYKLITVDVIGVDPDPRPIKE